ncbi:hypothetical protein A1OO_19225 [Enterovibrio norvegicus FF-33]|uniref:hypothetical protein n=1 Tax=Enterovibrio norvegicus TaxID=188144 RepID=UPI00030D892B|nr:hypothetical protein [Enterovibrio norvegicus]OEE67871.1 hypothetical protein A1OO_19225 [Enterovibrio norvegicus FF-33]
MFEQRIPFSTLARSEAPAEHANIPYDALLYAKNTPPFKQDIAVFNRLIPIEGKPTNLAIWAPMADLADTQETDSRAINGTARNPMRYYLTHQGDAVKARHIHAKPDIQLKKLCLIFPGFNGGPFDQFHLAETLAKSGYWVMSVGCYINPELTPSADPDKIALALKEAYATYPSVLAAFTQLTGMPVSPDTLTKIRYLSFSAGIYPLLRAISENNCPQWQHQMLLIAPGLSATSGLEDLLADAPVSGVDVIHSAQDTHPTFGDPLRYLTLFGDSLTQLHLLPHGEHYDFIHLPLSIQKSAQKTRASTSAQSQHEHAVKQECLAILSNLIQGETQ